MKLVSTHDMCTRTGEVKQLLQSEGYLIITSRGRPFALMLFAEDENVEALLLAVRRARAQLAVSKIRKQASEDGLARIPLDEIDEEIRNARNESRCIP